MFYKFSGQIISGKKLGRTIGFPTANMSLKNEVGIPGGTYCINGKIDGKIFRGVGVYRENIQIFEAHFFDFDGNLYGNNIEILIYSKIRDNIHFINVGELKSQIEKDVKFAKEENHNVLTFGTFDILHPGHEHYLNSAKMYGNRLITVVATEKNREKVEGNIPINNLKDRVNSLALLNISDIIEEGSEKNPMIWLEKYGPKVICLGYDQSGFSTLLDRSTLGIEIVRIDSYHPEQFKSSKLK